MSSFLARCLFVAVMASAVARAETGLSSWRSEPMAVAAAGDNNWYFFPDTAKNPRVLVKATGTGANVNRRFLSGGPPVWTTGDAVSTASLNKQGVLVPFVNGAFLVAPHNNILRLTFFNAAGTATISEIVDDSAPITSIGLSAALDPGSYLHIAYIGDPGTSNETLRYARRSASGTWLKANPRDLSTETSPCVRQSVILPSSSGAAKIYASLKTGTVASLHRMSVANGNIVAATGDGILENNIAEPIAGNRLGNMDRLYYFAGTAQQGHWNLKQAGTNNPIQTIGSCLPTSIICKPGPDSKQRIAWLDGSGKKIHYLKPGTTSAFDVIHPVTGTTGTAEVRGLHFDGCNNPYLLYRNSSSQAFIAFPDDEFDSDGNGRADLIDVAFNSTTAGIETLSPSAPVAGFPLSENKFKFRIPTIGSAVPNGAGGLVSSSQNLAYGVETSTDAVTWTPLGAGSPMSFVQHSSAGAAPNELRVFTGLYDETIPTAPSKRFFRIKISRPASF